MKHKEQELLQAYTRVSSSYDETRFVTDVEDFMLSALLKLLNVRPEMRLLDVAAGTGRTAIPLARTGATVMALDLTPAMMERMRSKAQASGLANLHLQQANAQLLPFPEHTFDIVISFRFFHLFSLEDQIPILSEMHRVSKPDGKVLVEYNNAGAAWTGGIVQDIFRRSKKQQSLNRVNREHLQKLYQPYRVLKQQGFSWPFIGTVARLSPKVAHTLLRWSMNDQLRRYSRYIWVLSTKSPSGNV